MAPILGVTRRRRAPPKRRPRRDRRRRRPLAERRLVARVAGERRGGEAEAEADSAAERRPTAGATPSRRPPPTARRSSSDCPRGDGRHRSRCARPAFAGRSELLRGALALVVGTSHRARERPERPGCAQGPILAGPGPRRAPVHSSKALERPLATARFAATRRLLAVSGVRATVAIPCRAARSSQRRHAEAKNDLPRPAAPLKCCRAELARRPVKTAGPDADA